MHVGAGSGEDARTSAPDDPVSQQRPPDIDGSFAVIHDEPHLTIVYEDGEFKGEIVDATLDRLEYARFVAAQYNLAIVHVRCDYYTNFKLYLKEKVVARQ